MRAAIVVLGVLAGAAPARADSEAKRLFEEGRVLIEQGKPAEACKRFALSLERERAGGTLLNLAECAERSGQLTRAWALYQEAAEEYERTSKGGALKFARERAAAIEPKLAIVIVRVADPGLRGLVLRIGGEEIVPAAKVSRFHDPGSLAISARAPGREPFETTIEGYAGSKVTVEVPALAVREREESEPQPPPPPPPETPAPRSDPWGIVMGISVAAVVSGAAVWLYGWRQIADAEAALCPPDPFGCGPVDPATRQTYLDQGERGRVFSVIGAVTVGVSVGLFGLGLYKVVTRPAAPAQPGPQAARATPPVISPILSPSAVGVGLSGGF